MASGWTMYSISKYFGARHRETIDEKLKRHRQRANDPRIQLVDRVNQLEDDLGRAWLLIQSLAESCIAKGVLSREEIAQMAQQVDLSDGVADGKLDPQALREAEPEEASRAATPEEYLRALELKEEAQRRLSELEANPDAALTRKEVWKRVDETSG